MTDKRASQLLSQNLTAIYGYAFSKLYDKDKVDDLTAEIVYEIIVSAHNLQNEQSLPPFFVFFLLFEYKNMVDPLT